jgi:hypothetical protein
MLRTLISLSLLTSTTLTGLAYAADDACIPAYEQAQSLRADGRLIAAREKAILCARSSCPKALAKDCTRWVGELDESIPSIVPQARAVDGTDATDVEVRMDGEVLTQKIDGMAVRVDPGEHKFAFTHSGAPTVEMVVVVHEGEKSRPVTATFHGATPAPVAPHPPQPPLPAQPAMPAASGGIPAAAAVAGAVGLVGIGLGTYFGLNGLSEKGNLNTCKPHCDPAAVDTMMHHLTLADVSFGAGAVALVAAVYLVLSRPKAESPLPAAAVVLDVTLTNGSAVVGTGGRF